MKNTPLPPPHPAFPRAILHVDGDAFFTSVEQALHPALRGRPVVTGRERGIIACASYEAKALGVKRGIALHEARRLCPGLVVLPSDYESYSLFSERMFAIMRRFAPVVEAYSIDEGFADITGMRGLLRDSYPGIAARLQTVIQAELDLTVSIGLSLSKGLAKIASDFRKPAGLTVVPAGELPGFLAGIPLAEVWGLGRNRVHLLEQHGVRTAWDYVNRPEAWIRTHLHKPGVEIWHELRGTALLPLESEPTRPEASISKTKTFSAPSDDPDFIRAKLVRNLESAFIKLRRHRLRTAAIAAHLRLRDYHEHAAEVRLDRSINSVQVAAPLVHALFDRLYRPGATYRSTGVVLTRFEPDQALQLELFADREREARHERLAGAADTVRRRYGKHTVFLATGLALDRMAPTDRDTPCWRRRHLLPGETARKRIQLPLLDIPV